MARFELVYGRLAELMVSAAGSETKVFNVILEAADKALSEELYCMLTRLTDTAALVATLDCGEGEGLEARRQITREYDPEAEIGTAGSMIEVLLHKFSSDSSTLISFERVVDEHVVIKGAEVPDENVVLSDMQDPAEKDHFMMNAKRLATYNLVREEVADIVRTRSSAGIAPMMVDASTEAAPTRGENLRVRRK